MTGLGGLLLDPVARKEIAGVSRRWQTYAGRVLYLGLIGLAVFSFWRSMHRAGALSVSEYAGLGRDLFHGFLPLQMTFVTLAAVSAASDSIGREARAGTLGLLLLTPLSPRRIAFGKWKGTMAHAGSLALCGLPILAICAYLGGVGPWGALWSTVLTLALASAAAALSLRYSAMLASPTRAMFATIGLLAVSLLPGGFLACFGEGGLQFAALYHPVFAAIGAAAPPSVGSPLPYLWIGATGVSAAVTWKLLGAAARRIEDRAQLHPRPAVARRDFETAGSYYGRERAGRRRLVVEAGVWDNHPLLWKELATRATARLSPEARMGAVFMFFLCLIVAGLATNGDGIPWGIGVLALLLTLVTGSSLFVHEREGKKIDVLLSTPVPAWRILSTKLLAGVLAPESLIVLGIGALVLLGWAGSSEAAVAFVITTACLLTLAFAYVVAAAASLRARTLRGAFVAALGLVGFLYFALPGLLALARGHAGSALIEWAVSPPALLSQLGRIPPGRFEALWQAFVLQCAAYGAALALLLALMVRRLKSLPRSA
jgi:ABC-type transport system involved in multi-copper enzyme maturation permease subunit